MNEEEKVFNGILFGRTGIDFQIHPELKDENLFGSKINLPPRELILILYDIEKIYGIHISDEILLKGDFCTYNNIKKSISYAYVI